jgi:hypothetical protein
MASPSSEPTATAEIIVGAPVDAVYDLVSDVTKTGEFAVECITCEWIDADGPAVGVRFRGSNRRGGRRWSTISKVTDAEPGSRFAFETTSLGAPVARWQYDLVATDDGCRVTESTWDQRPGWLKIASIPVTGVRDRTAENTQNIRTTLERLKAAVEKPRSSSTESSSTDEKS